MMDISIKKQISVSLAFAVIISAILSSYCILFGDLVSKSEADREVFVAANAVKRRCIVIDPGHGGEDGGAVGVNGVLEKDLNLSLSEVFAALLKFSGYEVILTRTEDKMLYDRNENFHGRKKMLDLKGRLEIAQSIGPDIFIGIHMNSFPVQKYSGLSIYYSNNSPESKLAAEIISKAIKSSIQPDNNRETKAANSNIYILNRITSPAILIECGFLSNPDECEKLSTYEYRKELSLVFYSSLVAFLKE